MARRVLLLIGPIVLGFALALSQAACTSPERAAQEAYELAQFEEKQGNADHAMQLYHAIVAKHSDTAWAEKARARLAEIQPVQP